MTGTTCSSCPFYAAYFLVILVLGFRLEHDPIVAALVFIDLVLLGSRTALAVFLAVIVWRNFFRYRLIGMILLPLFSITLFFSSLFLIEYSEQFRGQNILVYQELDRYILLSGYLAFFAEHFSIIDHILGWGPGRALEGLRLSDARLEAWALSRSTDGYLYSILVHNEIFRIFCDFGIAGLAIFALYVRSLGAIALPIVLLSLTNSTLYSSSVMLAIAIVCCLAPPSTATTVPNGARSSSAPRPPGTDFPGTASKARLRVPSRWSEPK